MLITYLSQQQPTITRIIANSVIITSIAITTKNGKKHINQLNDIKPNILAIINIKDTNVRNFIFPPSFHNKSTYFLK